MTQRELAQFVQRAVFQSPANLPASLTGEDIESTNILKVTGDIELSDKALASLIAALGL